ncbi:unnamed protein product [Cylicocyclus nassatus]|uniref:Uncharacterized protein n=1 Tax=Cylicocyclus nassatus TaxID=53992 RepID=A0AA36GSK0_CYLNA|nr:unnamed protein product [Cylicocyclus nassatus]
MMTAEKGNREYARLKDWLLKSEGWARPDDNAPQTLLVMITGELIKLGYEAWQPPLGDPGVVEHQRRPDLFSTPTPSTTCSTPASKHK